MIADRAAMAERGVGEGEIADDVAVWSDDRVTARIRDADQTVDF